MMTCPKCEASECVKDMMAKGKQPYLDHVCEYRLLSATGQQLWEAGKTDTLQPVMSDYWQLHEHVIPQTLHTQFQAETYTVEGYNQPLAALLGPPLAAGQSVTVKTTACFSTQSCSSC